MKLEINHRKRNEKKMIPQRLNNMLLKNQWVSDEIKEEIKKYLETNETENTTIKKSMGCSKSSPNREGHNYIGLPQKTRKKNLK